MKIFMMRERLLMNVMLSSQPLPIHLFQSSSNSNPLCSQWLHLKIHYRTATVDVAAEVLVETTPETTVVEVMLLAVAAGFRPAFKAS